MEEAIKNRIILILGILALMFFLGTIHSCGSARKNRLDLDKEKAASWDMQNKIEEIKRENVKLQNEFKAKTQELEEEKAAHQVTKKALLQEQLVNKSLKEEIEKVTKLKEALEEDLKEALVASKSTKSKK